MKIDKAIDTVINAVPQLQRGQVWCCTCGAMQKVDSASALRGGWTKCCGYTMTIDSPEEQRHLADVATKGKDER